MNPISKRIHHPETYKTHSYGPKTHRRKSEIDPKKRHILQILYTANQNATKRGLDFNLCFEDLDIPSHCPYLGWELTYRRGEGRLDTNFSINRIDNSKGYFKDNVEVCSDLANRMLQDCSDERLVIFATNILRMKSY